MAPQHLHSPGSPGPQLRGDEVDGGHTVPIRRRQEPKIEIRGIDRHEEVGRVVTEDTFDPTQQAQRGRHYFQRLKKPDDGQFLGVPDALHALGGQGRSANAGDLTLEALAPQRPHQARPMGVAAVLPCGQQQARFAWRSRTGSGPRPGTWRATRYSPDTLRGRQRAGRPPARRDLGYRTPARGSGRFPVPSGGVHDRWTAGPVGRSFRGANSARLRRTSARIRSAISSTRSASSPLTAGGAPVFTA